jgi:MtN3 and saliva related transmembrane protein
MVTDQNNSRTTMQVTDMIGYAAATLTTVSFVPQVWRTFRTHDVSGISLRMYSIFTAGIACWLIYGIVLEELPMILANSLSLVLACAVLVMRLRYAKEGKNQAQPQRAPENGAVRVSRTG